MENAASHSIRVAIVDDHIIVSEMLALSISKESDLALVGVVGNTVDAMKLVRRELPDVLLMNYRLPDGDCVGTIKGILIESPKTRVVVLSASAEGDFVSRATAAGCVGFLGKECSIADVLHAIRRAARGESVPEADVYSP